MTQRSLGILVTVLILLGGAGWWLSRAETGKRVVEGTPGLWLAGPGEPFGRMLDQLAELEATPLGRLAETARERIVGCDEVFAFDDRARPEQLVANLGCRSETDALPGFAEGRAARGDPVVLALAWTTHEGEARLGGSLVARLQQAEDDLEAELEVDVADGVASPLLAADSDPGGFTLDPHGTLLHTRVVADRGLDLGSWMEGSGAAGDERHVFALRKEDFAGLLLGDTWEVAVYLPEEGDALPAMALAVEISSRRLVAAAMDDLLAEGEKVWSWGRPAAVEVAGAEGRCLDELRLLPNFTPCYALDGERLYLSWDRRSLARALARVAAITQPPRQGDERSWLRLELGQFALAEERLARANGAGETTPRHWPWSRLVATATERDGRYVYHLRLED